MLYVYRKEASTGARDLAEALGGLRYRALRRPIEQRVRRGDTVVCWGESLQLPATLGVRVLNGGALRNKLQDAQRLAEAGVPTIEVSTTRPQAPAPQVGPDPALPIFEEAKTAVEDFLELDFSRSNIVYRDGVRDLAALLTRFHGALSAPIPMVTVSNPTIWLPRLRNHVGGTDLMNPPSAPDFFVKKEDIRQEYRIHSFQGRSLRAGVKRPRDGQQAHDWIRSWDGGWRIVYDGVTSRQRHRDLAHSAVEALNLDFGAVDIGEKADGSLLVLEVNRAPGLEGGTIDAYVRAIQAWSNGQ